MRDKKEHPFKNNKMPLAMKLYFIGLSLTFKILAVISPKLAGKLALRIFMIPPNVAPPRRESKIREHSKLSYSLINDKKIALRVWESETTDKDASTILLSHGWAGRTSQFLDFIEPLLEAGYRVVGADIPGHGDSSGKHTNMLESTQVLSTIAKEFGPLAAIIGHSFGTGTILLGMDKFGIEAPKVILIGAYSRVSFIINLFSDVFNLNHATREAMKQAGTDKFANTYGIKWDWESIAPVNTIKSYTGKLLFIHDETDHEVPMHEVTELHQSRADAKVMITSGFGHRRILRNKDVIDSVLAFIENS